METAQYTKKHQCAAGVTKVTRKGVSKFRAQVCIIREYPVCLGNFDTHDEAVACVFGARRIIEKFDMPTVFKEKIAAEQKAASDRKLARLKGGAM